MWSDNETSRDFLNFRAVASTVAEMIVQADGRPLSIGVSGSWGVGKSSLVKLIQEELAKDTGQKFVFVEFNAWLYQGYDDARAALMEVIAREILRQAPSEGVSAEKARDFLKRVKWIRAAGYATVAGAAMYFGIPVPGAIGKAIKAAKGVVDGDVTEADADAAAEAGKEVKSTGAGLLKDKSDATPPEAIHDLREQFQATLKEMGVTLVVLIDDLDRCLPPTAIATLEAIRLFLFLDHTAFVIAADEKMIREAVRSHFKDVRLDDDLVTNYFDKLIQVPVRVPPLGTQDVRAYLMLLYVENSGLPEPKRDAIREAVCRQLSETWKGKRVDARFVRSLIEDCPSDLSAKLELADRLAPLMTTTKQILGNPRLIKRFLNTLSIRLSTAKAQGVTVDEAALAKMLLFERSGKDTSYRRLVSAVNESDEGKPTFLGDWEKAIRKGEAPPALEAGWDDEFSKSWLALEPAFSDLDLRAVVYVSRDHLPIITAADQLSAEGINILEGLLAIVTAESRDLTEQLKLLAPREVQQILSRLLQKARPVQQWGVPPILYACLTVASVGDEHAKRVADFLKELPPKQLNAGIIPLIASKPWAPHVLAHWSSQIDTPDPVKRAIAASSKKAG